MQKAPYMQKQIKQKSMDIIAACSWSQFLR